MHQLSQIHLFVEFDALEGRTNYKVSQSGVSIYKRSFDQLIIIRECEDTNYKTLTIFIFFNFNHLPFF